MYQKFKQTFLNLDAPISEAVSILDQLVQIALIVDADERLLGTVTDGDVRRGLLSGKGLDSPVKDIMNDNPKTAAASMALALAREQMTKHFLLHMPILNETEQVVGLITFKDINAARKNRENIVVLMAGGLGSRLKPLTDNIPKPMLKIGPKPLLETIIDSLIEQGFNKFLISINYHAAMIKQHFGNGENKNVEIGYLEETERLGTAGPLSLIKGHFEHPIIVMNADLLTKLNFDHLLEYHQDHGAPATMCIREYDFQVPYGVVSVDDRHIVSIDEKPVHKFFVNAGIQVIEPNILNLIPAETYFDMPELFEKLVAANTPATVFPILEYWLDVGRIDDYARAEGDFKKHFE